MPAVDLEITDRGAAREIKLARPDKRNALSLELIRDLTEALRDAGDESSVRAVILSGAGTVFSAGHDLSEMLESGEEAYRDIFESCTLLMQTIHLLPVPVIARVHGLATAAGCQLVAACDLVFASNQARFATPGVKIGLFCHTPMVELSRSVGRKKAMLMLLTGDTVDALTAEQWGLVTKTLPEAELDAEIDRVVEAIAASSRWVLAQGKRAFYEQIDTHQAHAYPFATALMVEAAASAHAREGIAAFLEKRRPVWRE
jgi:enoyl-CoA hydratase/carnithine racemase